MRRGSESPTASGIGVEGVVLLAFSSTDLDDFGSADAEEEEPQSQPVTLAKNTEVYVRLGNLTYFKVFSIVKRRTFKPLELLGRSNRRIV